MAPKNKSQKKALKVSKTYWTTEQYNLFLELCMKGTEQNKRQNRGWGASGYQFLIDGLSAHGHHFTEEQLKSKWDWMQKKWKLWDGLLKGETGLGWDEATGKIIASPEWWNEKIKENSKYKKIRDEGIDRRIYRILDSLFRGIIANGRAGYTPSSNELPNDVNGGESDEERGNGHGFDESFEDQENDVEVSLDNLFTTGDFSKSKSDEVESVNLESQAYARKKNRDDPTCSLGVKKVKGKKGRKKQPGAACLAESIENLGESLKNKAHVMAEALKEPPGSSIEEVLIDIETLDGIEEGNPFWSFCASFLMKNKARRTYAAIKTPKGKLEFLKYNFNLGA